MSKAKTISYVAGGISALIGVSIVAITFLGAHDDQKDIQEAITKSIKAGKEGSGGGVLEHVSVDLRVNDTSYGGARDISGFVRQYKPEVEIPPITAKVFGDEAQINTNMKLTVGILGNRTSFPLKDVIISMKKEEDRMWLIFPSKTWKVSQVKIPANSVPEALFSFGQ